MDEIRLRFADNATQIQHQLRHVSPPKPASASSPMKLLYAGRDRSALGRPGISFKPEIKDPMRCGRQLGKKAVIVRGIRGGEVDDAHVGLREYLASLRAQVDPAQLLALKQIAQSPRPDNLGKSCGTDKS